LDLDGLGGWGGEETNDGFVVGFDVRTTKKVFSGRVLDGSEDICHGSRDDPRQLVVSRLERGEGQHRSTPPSVESEAD